MSERETVLIEVINGPEGACLSVGDDTGGHRLAGPKSWGGGRTIHRFTVRSDELIKETLALCPKARADIAQQREAELVELLSAAKNYIDSFGYALARSKADRNDAIDIRNSMNNMLLRLDRALAFYNTKAEGSE